jgi:two-component system response regulator MprA
MTAIGPLSPLDARSDTPGLSPHPAGADVARSGQAILLIVERDPHVRELERFFLTDAGFEVHFVSDGLAALELARKLTPQILVTDVIVPKLDGLALCRTIKATDGLRDTVVVVFSLLAVEQRAREAGADAFLMKPLGADRLISTVRALLNPSQRSANLGAAQ